MKKQLLILSALCFFLSACQTDNKSPSPSSSQVSSKPVETEADRAITQQIRQLLMDDDSLSIGAKNIKIITMNGVVTLRGTVNSEREKTEIGRKTKSMSGVRTVDNQLEVKTISSTGATGATGAIDTRNVR